MNRIISIILIVILLTSTLMSQTKIDYTVQIKNLPVIPLISRQTADSAGSASTTAVSTAVTFAVSANTTYTLDCDVFYTVSTTATNGLRLYISGPASPSWVRLGATIYTTVTASNWYPVTAFSSAMGASVATTVTTVQYAHLTGSFATSGTAGTVTLQFSNNGTTGSTVIKQGTWCQMQ